VHERTSGRRRFGAGSIALSLGLALVAGQIVATQPAAAAAAARPLPKLTQSVSRSTISYGQTVRITAKVFNSKTGKHLTSGRVRLQAYRNGWKTWQVKSIASTGSVSFSSKPLGSISYRTVFLGGGGARAGISRNVSKVTVRATGSQIVAEAARHKGALYKYAAAGPSRFDCSGFTLYVYKKTTGRKLPHKANTQQKYGSSIAKGSKKAGDLIIFRSGSYGYHAAVYAGSNKIWDSPHTGARVSKRKMISSNYVVRRLS
jgi:cell wall-associated NlpC family hydrolase